MMAKRSGQREEGGGGGEGRQIQIMREEGKRKGRTGSEEG